MESVRTLCGEPPDCPLVDGGLPSNLIFETLTSIEDEMLRDLDLGMKSRRVAMEDIDLSEGDSSFSIHSFDYHAPAYAYLQTDADSDIWFPVEILNHAGLLTAAENRVLGVGFHGAGSGEVSWIPEGSQRLRLWYERNTGDDPTLSESTELGALYDSYLKLQTAVQCRELMKLEVGTMLLARLRKSESQWQRFTNRSNQRGTGAKAPVTPFRRRAHYGLDRRKFFVP